MYMDRPVPHPRSVAALGFALIALHDGWWRGERLGSVGVIACEVIVQGGACCVSEAMHMSEVRFGQVKGQTEKQPFTQLKRTITVLCVLCEMCKIDRVSCIHHYYTV
jgi:hypothetical protein